MTTATTLRERETDMFLRTSRSDAYAIAASATLALAGMLIVRRGDSNGWWMLLAFSTTAALVLVRPYLPTFDRQEEDEVIDVTAWGIRHFDHSGLHEAVSWQDITEVSVITSHAGHGEEDIHLMLRGLHDNGVIVPHTLAVENGVLTALESRLPHFDNDALVTAITSEQDGVFVLWRAPQVSSIVEAAHHHSMMPPLRAAS